MSKQHSTAIDINVRFDGKLHPAKLHVRYTYCHDDGAYLRDVRLVSEPSLHREIFHALRGEEPGPHEIDCELLFDDTVLPMTLDVALREHTIGLSLPSDLGSWDHDEIARTIESIHEAEFAPCQ